jgi:hypothetical protein
MPLEDDPKFLACCILFESQPQFHFGEFPHHPLELIILTIVNCPRSRNRLDLYQVSVEAKQSIHLYLSSHQETFGYVPVGRGTEMCWSAIMHEVRFSTNDKWHVGYEIRHVVFQVL